QYPELWTEFFFSSRRRHTGWPRDWSSDVCSSDLVHEAQVQAIARAVAVDRLDLGFVDILPCEGCLDHPLLGPRDELFRRRQIVEIGRASCRERGDLGGRSSAEKRAGAGCGCWLEH